MKDCFQIKSSEQLIKYVAKHGRDVFDDFDYQLKTNAGFVHKLKNGEIVFFPNTFQGDAILFSTKKCFDDIIKKDRFPVENPGKELYEIEEERIKTFHLQANHYRQHLNTVLKFDFPEITKEAAQAYLKKVIGRFIKKLTTETDMVALISVIGELVKQEVKGKWFLEKRYGYYNPIFEPNIVAKNGDIISISNLILGKIKWRISSLEDIFTRVHSRSTPSIKWKTYSKGRKMILLG